MILPAADFELRLGAADMEQLTDLDRFGTMNAARRDAALADAEAEVMGYVRMATPALLPDPAPENLKRLVFIAARYNLWRREVTEDHPVYVAYRDAVKELRAIAAGQISLPLPVTQANAGSFGPAAIGMPERAFTDAALAGMLP